MPGPAGYPASRTAASWVFDALVTVLAAATGVPGLFHHKHYQPGVADFVVLALIVAPLVARRIWPLQVFGWVVVTSIAAALWDYHLIAGAALLVSLYTVASLRPRRDALVCAGVLEVGVFVGLAVGHAGQWWYDVIFLSGLVAAALGLGLYFATRRAYLTELHDRAARLERERDQQGEIAAAAERARIAREMHDIVAHHLTVMITLSDAAVAASARSPERAAEVMRSVSATGRRALGDTRRLLGGLRRPPGDGSGAALAPVPDLAQLDALIEQVRSAGLDTTLEIHGDVPEVPAGVQLTVYRLVQEALTNTLKHGGAGARAYVRLRYLPGELRVDIEDDGVGTTVPAAASVGSGLIGMRERVRAYGGDVRAGPRQPGGWSVSARLQLDSGEPSGPDPDGGDVP